MCNYTLLKIVSASLNHETFPHLWYLHCTFPQSKYIPLESARDGDLICIQMKNYAFLHICKMIGPSKGKAA